VSSDQPMSAFEESEGTAMEEGLPAAGQRKRPQKPVSLGRVVSGIMHDFNNVLTTILGYTEFLLLDESLTEDSAGYVQEIRDSANRGSDLIRQALLFCKGKSRNMEALNLNDVICDIEGMLKRLIGEDIVFIKVLASDLDDVLCDTCHIQQILMNLICNARDAVKERGKVILETANIEYDEDVGDIEAGRYVVLSVRDTGVGMEESTRDQMFDPFFSTKENGTGLGLATVFEIVDGFGGSIRVQSEPGRGTTVRIIIPAMAPSTGE
jgi:two-component system cell cycle sensor histidine kinase/response regulator CckA